MKIKARVDLIFMKSSLPGIINSTTTDEVIFVLKCKFRTEFP